MSTRWMLGKDGGFRGGFWGAGRVLEGRLVDVEGWRYWMGGVLEGWR